MAACCANVAVGGGSFFSTISSNVRPQPSPSIPLSCCCTQPHRRSGGSSILRRPRSTKESRAQGQRRRSWGLPLQQPQTEFASSPTFCCLPTDVSSSDGASAELNVVEGNESGTRSGMSIEERDAIIAFEEGLSLGATAEEGNSSEYPQLSGDDEEPKALQGMEKSEEDVAAREGQQKMYESSSPKAAKGQGATIANVVTLFVTLLERPSPGDGRIIAATGNALLERVEEEVGKLQAVEGVDGQSLFESLRVVKLLRMDIQLVAAARKDTTLSDRLEQTKAHCRQLLNIVSTL